MPEETATAPVSSGFAGMLNAFVDPAGTAKRVPAKLFWLWPLITLCIIYLVVGFLMQPFMMQLTDTRVNQSITQQNLPPERAESARNIGHMITRIIPIGTPLIVILFMVILSWLVGVTGSMFGVRVKFRDIFSLMAACSLITALQYIAVYIVVNAKGDEITSQEQFSPPFGLDIFFQDLHGPALALLNYFSIFQIWYIVMLGLSLAALTRSSKGKAFAAITPAWLIPLLFRVVGAAFGGGSNS